MGNPMTRKNDDPIPGWGNSFGVILHSSILQLPTSSCVLALYPGDRPAAERNAQKRFRSSPLPASLLGLGFWFRAELTGKLG